MDIFIGIGSREIKGDYYNDCWSIFKYASKIALEMKNKQSNYNNHNECLKEGDIVEVILDRKIGNLSFAVNDVNFGLACSNIPKEETLYPTIVLYEQGISVEIV